VELQATVQVTSQPFSVPGA